MSSRRQEGSEADNKKLFDWKLNAIKVIITSTVALN